MLIRQLQLYADSPFAVTNGIVEHTTLLLSPFHSDTLQNSRPYMMEGDARRMSSPWIHNGSPFCHIVVFLMILQYLSHIVSTFYILHVHRFLNDLLHFKNV